MGYILVHKNGSTKKVAKLPATAVLINEQHSIYEVKNANRNSTDISAAFTLTLEKDGVVVVRDLLVFKSAFIPDVYTLVTDRDVECLTKTAYRVINGKRIVKERVIVNMTTMKTMKMMMRRKEVTVTMNLWKTRTMMETPLRLFY